jgi:aminoglycoside phosphotransferase
LQKEEDNLALLKPFLNVPDAIACKNVGGFDYLLLSKLNGKNLVEISGEIGVEKAVELFAVAVREMHSVDVNKVFPGASTGDVLTHGDMSLPNIIVDGQGQIGFIDVGQLNYGHPEKDLADGIWSLQRNFGQGYGELFLKHYGAVEVTPKMQEMLDFVFSESG